jgi:hypothetical protein
MTAAEHIAEAELNLQIDWRNSTPEQIANCLALVQAHATLALAAATIDANRLRPGPSVDRGPR